MSCISADLVRGRGVEPPAGGPIADRSVEICNLIDENSNTVFEAGQIPPDEFEVYLKRAEGNRGIPTVANLYGLELVTLGKGQLFSFPPNCERTGTLDYRCVRDDGLIEQHTFVEDSELATWRYLTEVRNRDGRLIRRREKKLSPAGVTNAEMTSLTTWYVGGMEFIAAADNWPHRFTEHPNKNTEAKARHIGARYLNPYRPATTYTHKVGSSFTLDSFTYDHSWQRNRFYRSIDHLVADHEVTFYPGEKTVVIDNQAIHLETRPGSTAITEAELWDRLFGFVHFAPFLHRTDLGTLQILWGDRVDLAELARKFGVEACLEGLWKWSNGNSCPPLDSILLLADKSIDEQENNTGHSRGIPHEASHILWFDDPSLFSERDFLRTVCQGLVDAGVPRGSDFDFLMAVADGDVLTSNLPQGEQDRLESLWKKYDLGRFFPSSYAFSRVREFLPEMTAIWEPWHRYEADHLPLNGLIAALDNLSIPESGSFHAALNDAFPGMNECRWSPPVQISSPLPSLGEVLRDAVGLLASGLSIYLGVRQRSWSRFSRTWLISIGLLGLASFGTILYYAWNLRSAHDRYTRLPENPR